MPEERAVALPAGWRLDHRTDVGSTNDEAAALALAGAPHGTVVTADRQSRGRGRRGRSWESPAGNLFCSVVLRPDCAVAVAGQLSFAAALAVADALQAWIPERALALKWPNDVLAGGAKISGVLLESAARPDGRLDWLVVGAGVNVASHPDAAAYPTTALSAWIAETPSPGQVLARYIDALDRWAGVWTATGFAPLRSAWLARAHGLGAPMRVRTGNETLEGRFDTVDEGGALVLGGGAVLRRVTAGDVLSGAA